LAEWLYEAGIGENRAALIEQHTILEAAIDWPDELRLGTVLDGRLTAILIPGKRGIVGLGEAGEALIEPLDPRIAAGAAVRIEIVREALPEAGRPRLPKARATEAEPRPGPSLAERIAATSHAVIVLPAHGPDRLEAVGWSELLEEAASGEIAFAGGSLRMSLTPAMTLFDVDGALPPGELARAGAAAAGRAIRRFGIGGSIGIDLPTLAAKADRQAAAAALDAVLPQPFERTAVNGFGFLQIVRRRERPSIPERLQSDRAGAAARALLRRAARDGGRGERTLVAAAPVIARIEARPDWLERLARSLGAPVALRADPGLAISAGHVHSAFS
jgi:hypothetical protein